MIYKTYVAASGLSVQVVKDNYPKFLLTMDDDPPSDNDGIRQINVLDWLTEATT